MVNNIFLGIGSNKGNRKQYIDEAIDRIRNNREIIIINISSVYETEPYGVKNQSNYLNLVIEIKSTYSPVDLLNFLKNIEKEIGRKAAERWGAREIDIDILFYGCEIVKTEDLTIPHADLVNRDFVLYPLNEIAPEFIHPVFNKSVFELLSNNLKKTIIGKYKFSTD